MSGATILLPASQRLWPAAAGLPPEIFAACVRDTADRLRGGDRELVALDGPDGLPGQPCEVEDGAPDEALARAVGRFAGPVAVIGPTVPQIDDHLIQELTSTVEDPWHEAVVGLTDDEGFWALGLQRSDPMALLGVPLDHPQVGRHLLDRLHGLGLMLGLLPRLVSADTLDGARTVAAELPESRLRRALTSRP